MKKLFVIVCAFQFLSQLHAQCGLGGCGSCAPAPISVCRTGLSPNLARVNAGQTLFVYGDYLLWSAKEDGLEFVLTNADGITGTVTDGAIETVTFPWTGGFRVGIGANAFWDCWDTEANWTRFSTTPEKTLPLSLGDTVQPLWGNQLAVPFDGPGSISAKLTVHYNIIDWILGRHIFLSNRFDFRPFLGATGGWINQKYAIVNASSAIPITQSINNRCFFRGIGIKTGFSTLWEYCYGLGLYGNCAASLLYGKYEIAYAESFTGTGGIFNSFSDDFTTSRAALQLALGLKWDTDFCNGRSHLWLSAGVESNVWFQMNQFVKSISSSVGGTTIYDVIHLDTDLVVQGLTFRARLDF